MAVDGLKIPFIFKSFCLQKRSKKGQYKTEKILYCSKTLVKYGKTKGKNTKIQNTKFFQLVIIKNNRKIYKKVNIMFTPIFLA